MNLRLRVAVGATVVGFALGACGADSNNGFGGSNDSNSNSPSGGGQAPGSNANFGGGAASSGGQAVTTLPPESKVESNFQSPVTTGSIVWLANPASGRVDYVDATTFGVKSVEAGGGPTYLAAVPDPVNGHDVAVVYNVTSQNATLLDLTPPAHGSGSDIDGALATRILPSTPYANAWAVSSSGRWAIAWTDTSRVSDATQGYEEIAIADLRGGASGTGTVTLLAVGFDPVQIAFSGDSYAYAVTSDGIAVIDLLGGSAPTVTANYPLQAAIVSDAGSGDAGSDAGTGGDAGTGSDAGAVDDAGDRTDASASTDGGEADGGDEGGGGEAGPPGSVAVDAGTASGAPDVSFTPDATYALVRQDGVASITVIALAQSASGGSFTTPTGATTTVPLPDLPTDLTMSPTGDFALAVLRDTSTVVTLPIPGIATAPTSFTTTTIAGATIGRAIVTSGGESALLFTTVSTAATPDDLTVLTFQPAPAYRTIALHAPVFAVFPTPDGANAVVLHEAGGNKFSVVPVAAALPANITALPAPPLQVALTDDRALVTVSDGASTNAVFVASMPSLVATEFALASPPLSVGIVSPHGAGDAGTGVSAFVSQDYSEGRITFLDLEADAGPQTITGFELSAGIVEGTVDDQ